MANAAKPFHKNIHFLCIASYVVCRTMKIVVDNLLSKYLIAENNPHSKEYSILLADLQAVKILHLPLTFAVPFLLSPRFGEHA